MSDEDKVVRMGRIGMTREHLGCLCLDAGCQVVVTPRGGYLTAAIRTMLKLLTGAFNDLLHGRRGLTGVIVGLGAFVGLPAATKTPPARQVAGRPLYPGIAISETGGS